jgi:hypothetical protein
MPSIASTASRYDFRTCDARTGGYRPCGISIRLASNIATRRSEIVARRTVASRAAIDPSGEPPALLWRRRGFASIEVKLGVGPDRTRTGSENPDFKLAPMLL